jgi:hypothetical protein
VSHRQSHCRVFVSLTGLDWTRLDSVGVYAPLVIHLKPSLPTIPFVLMHRTEMYVGTFLITSFARACGYVCVRARVDVFA